MKRFALTLAAGLLVLAAASAANAAPPHGPHHRGHGYHAYRAPQHGAYHYRQSVRHYGYPGYHHAPKPYYGPYHPQHRAPHHGVYRPVYPGCGPYPYSHGGVQIGGPHYSFGIRW